MGKVLLFSTQMLNTGGIESHLIEFCRLMSFAGHSVDLIVPKCKLDDSNLKNLKRSCSKVYLFYPKHSWIDVLQSLFLPIRLIFNRYDSLYTNGQGNTIFLVSKLFRYKKFVHHHHTSGDELDQQTWPKSYIKAMQNADEVVACSYINAERISKKIKRPVISVPVFSRNLYVSELVNKSKDSKIHFGYYGRLIPEKGVDLICKLSEDDDCKHICFHLWGTGQHYTAEYFKKYPNLVYHGSFNSKDELQRIVSILDGYLLLSRHHEGLPVSLLEVMSNGLPWLSTNKGGIPDLFIDPKSTRLMGANASYNEFKEAVIQFSSDCRNKLINKEGLIKMYAEKYSSEIIMSKWESLFNLN